MSRARISDLLLGSPTRRMLSSAGLALVVSVVASRVGVQSVAQLAALTCVALVGWIVIARMRRLAIPQLRLFSIGLASSEEDGPKRTTDLVAPIHYLTHRHPLVVIHSADRPVDDAGRPLRDAPDYLFVVGLETTIARTARKSLDNAFNGTGCLINEIAPADFPLYRHVLAAWRQADAAAEAARAAKAAAGGGA